MEETWKAFIESGFKGNFKSDFYINLVLVIFVYFYFILYLIICFGRWFNYYFYFSAQFVWLKTCLYMLVIGYKCLQVEYIIFVKLLIWNSKIYFFFYHIWYWVYWFNRYLNHTHLCIIWSREVTYWVQNFKGFSKVNHKSVILGNLSIQTLTSWKMASKKCFVRFISYLEQRAIEKTDH